MKIYKKFIALLFVFAFFVACGGVNTDAKKAAEFTNESIKQTTELKFEAAEKSFKKAQQILSKYKEHPKSEEFYKLYQKYRDKDVAKPQP